MTTGSISYEEFRNLVENFIDCSNKIDDKWHVEYGTNGWMYMCRKVQMVTSCIDKKATLTKTSLNNSVGPLHPEKLECHRTAGSELQETELLAEMEMNESEMDESCMPADICQQQPLTYEHHVTYSESFGVPVLYFNIFKSDGRRLSLEEVWKLCPSMYQNYVKENKWSTLTQQEHPILGRPYLQLHPCHTSDLMAQVTSGVDSDKRKNYLVTWLSTVGPMAGLHISHEYIT